MILAHSFAQKRGLFSVNAPSATSPDTSRLFYQRYSSCLAWQKSLYVSSSQLFLSPLQHLLLVYITAPNYTPLSHVYYAPETPTLLHKKWYVDEETLPSFGSSAPEAGNLLHIKAFTAEIKQLPNILDKLTKEQEMLGYKKWAPRLSVAQKSDAMIKAIVDVAKLDTRRVPIPPI